MLGRMLSAAMLSTAIMTMGGIVGGAAFAQEVVYNRGNDTDPTTLDHRRPRRLRKAS